MGFLGDNFKAMFGVQDTERTAEGTGQGALPMIVEHPEAEIAAQNIISRGADQIATTVAPSKVVFHEDYFKLNEIYQRVIFIESWPVEVAPNWLRELYQWQRPLDIVLYYQPLPARELLKLLKTKWAREAAEIAKDEAEGNPIDFARVQRFQDSLKLQELLQRGETKPFQLSLMICVRADSLRELNEITLHIEKAIDGLGARSRRAELIQKDAFLSCLPFGRNYIADAYTTRNMHTQAAMYTFPLANADLSHADGIWYGINRSTNSNVILDRFQLQSPHSLVLGSSGSGKSYSSKLEALRALMHGLPVIVVDPDAEYERMCAETGGQFITISPSSADRINALDFSHIADGVEDHLTPKILSVLKLIGAMVNPGGEGYGLNAEQVEILERLMREMYADFGYTQDPRTQVPVGMGGHCAPERMPVFSDLRARIQRFIEDHEHQPQLAAMMTKVVSSIRPYCAGGLFAGLFDQKTTVNLSEQLVVFNIKELTKDQHLMNLGMHTVLEFVRNAVMNKATMLSGQRRLLFVDEAHVMMRNPESAQFLEDLLRRARKFNVGVTVLSQDPDDFVRPDRPQGRAILGNSAMQVVLRMKRRSLELLQDLLGLDDTEVDVLSVCDTGEGMIFAMNERAWISMRTASPYEHEMVTTNPDEVAVIEARRRATELHAQQMGHDPAQLAGPSSGGLPAAGQSSTAAPLPPMADAPRRADRPPALQSPRVPTIQAPEPIAQVGPAVDRTVQDRRRQGPPAPIPAPGADRTTEVPADAPPRGPVERFSELRPEGPPAPPLAPPPTGPPAPIDDGRGRGPAPGPGQPPSGDLGRTRRRS